MTIPTVPNLASLPQMHEETKERMDEILRALSSIQVTLALLLVLGRRRDELSKIAAVAETLQNSIGEKIGEKGEVSDLPLSLHPQELSVSLAGLSAFVEQFRDNIGHDSEL